MSNTVIADPRSPFVDVVVGSVVTQFGEKALRVHHARFLDPPPAWFTPDRNKQHGAAHLNGFSVYWESEYNDKLRRESHPFLTEVVTRTISQLTFLKR